MKIQTLLELINPELKMYDMKNKRFDPEASGSRVSRFSLSDKDKEAGYLGAGKYSTVKTDRDPHFVKKTSRSSGKAKSDGYWYFIKVVIRNKLWENPYFPRVYEFKKYYKGDEAHYRVKLESLVDLNDLSKKEIEAVIARMSGNEDRGSYYKEENMDHISEIVRAIFWKRTRGLFKNPDPNLLSAMNTLRKINKGNVHLRPDLHKGNIMFRRGPHGVHPVIVDPFH